MGREIKFRGKRIGTGEWVYGNYAKTDLGTFIVQYRVDYELEGTYTTIYEVIPESVGQYTGLKDKNGKEIYEGNIVRFGEITQDGEVQIESVLAIIAFEKGCFLTILNNNADYRFLDKVCEFEKDLEIIGNTIDNTELLEV